MTVRTLLCGEDLLLALCHNPAITEALAAETRRGYPLPRDLAPTGFVLGDLHVVCARRYAESGGRHPVDGIGPGDARLV